MKNKEVFSLVIINQKIKSYIRLGYAFMFMNLISFFLLLLIKASLITPIVGFSVTLLYFLIKRIWRKKFKRWLDEDLFFLLAAVWLWYNMVMAVLVFLLGLLFKVTLTPFRFTFSEEGIQKDFFPKKNIEWNTLDTVVLKAGILTLDYKDNRLMQAPIEHPEETDENKFNQFASAQLQKNN